MIPHVKLTDGGDTLTTASRKRTGNETEKESLQTVKRSCQCLHEDPSEGYKTDETIYSMQGYATERIMNSDSPSSSSSEINFTEFEIDSEVDEEENKIQDTAEDSEIKVCVYYFFRGLMIIYFL